MARKVFQHFAHVLCQRFVEVPSNRDLVNLVLWGGGNLHLDITGRRATVNGYQVEPLPYVDDALHWLEGQIAKQGISPEQLVSAALAVEYTLTTTRRHAGAPILTASFDFSCTSSVVAPDRTYTSTFRAEKVWGLMQV